MRKFTLWLVAVVMLFISSVSAGAEGNELEMKKIDSDIFITGKSVKMKVNENGFMNEMVYVKEGRPLKFINHIFITGGKKYFNTPGAFEGTTKKLDLKSQTLEVSGEIPGQNTGGAPSKFIQTISIVPEGIRIYYKQDCGGAMPVYCTVWLYLPTYLGEYFSVDGEDYSFPASKEEKFGVSKQMKEIVLSKKTDRTVKILLKVVAGAGIGDYNGGSGDLYWVNIYAKDGEIDFILVPPME